MIFSSMLPQLLLSSLHNLSLKHLTFWSSPPNISNTFLPLILVSYCYCNKLQTWWFKTIHIYCLTIYSQFSVKWVSLAKTKMSAEPSPLLTHQQNLAWLITSFSLKHFLYLLPRTSLSLRISSQVMAMISQFSSLGSLHLSKLKHWTILGPSS